MKVNAERFWIRWEPNFNGYRPELTEKIPKFREFMELFNQPVGIERNWSG